MQRICKETYKVDVPDTQSAVLGAGRQFTAIWWESTEPNLIVVLRQHLSSCTWKLVPTSTAIHRLAACSSNSSSNGSHRSGGGGGGSSSSSSSRCNCVRQTTKILKIMHTTRCLLIICKVKQRILSTLWKSPHRYGKSHAIRDHTVLPATRQWWLFRLYPSRSWYSI